MVHFAKAGFDDLQLMTYNSSIYNFHFMILYCINILRLISEIIVKSVLGGCDNKLHFYRWLSQVCPESFHSRHNGSFRKVEDWGLLIQNIIEEPHVCIQLQCLISKCLFGIVHQRIHRLALFIKNAGYLLSQWAPLCYGVWDCLDCSGGLYFVCVCHCHCFIKRLRSRFVWIHWVKTLLCMYVCSSKRKKQEKA